MTGSRPSEVASVCELTGGQSIVRSVEALALSIIEDLVDRGLMQAGGIMYEGWL